MRTALRRNLLFVVLVFIITTNVTAQIVSNFTTNDEGWTIFVTSTGASVAPTYIATGGNPMNSGEISYATGTSAVGFYFTAPAKFKGDLSAAYNQNFTFDIHASYPGGDNSIGDVIISNSAAGASLYYQLPGKPPYMGYSGGSYTIQLVETFTGWHYGSMTGATPTAAQMKLVLGNVTNLQIREKYIFGNTFTVYGYLDNVSVGIASPTVTTQPTSIAVCEGANATLTTAATGNVGITYQWQKQNSTPMAIIWNDVANGGGYSGATSSSLVVNTTGNFGAGNYRCKISAPYAADSYSSNAVIGINPLPAAPTTTGGSGCNPSTVSLSAAGGTNGQYRWYTVASNGTAIAGQTNANYTTPSLTATNIYYVAINNGTCESTRTAVTATINNPPTAPTTTGSAACAPGTLTLTAAGGAAGQYRWYTALTGGTAISGQTNATYSPSFTATTTYYVSINNGTCESTRTAVTGTINTPPNAPTTTGSAACAPGTLTLTAAGGAAGQYRWYTILTGGTAIGGQTNATYSPSFTATTTYYVSVNNGTCESTRTAVTGTINTPPNAPTTTGSSACAPGTLTLTAAGGTAGQYRWYTTLTGGTAIGGQTNATYSPSFTATTTYYISINNGTCESTRTAVTGTINTPPNAPTTTGSSACAPGTLTLTAAGGAAGQYRWYTTFTGGTAISGQTNATYSPSFTATTSYYVSINNGTCESTRTSATGTINTPPNAPTTTGSAACAPGTLTLTAAGGAAGQYRWYTTLTGGTAISGQTNATYSPSFTATTTYYVSINNGTCESTRTAVTGTINTPPNAPTATGSATCATASVTLTASGGANGQYRWYTVASGGTSINGETNSTYATPALKATTTYYVSISNGTCESSRTAVIATLGGPTCQSNEPPVIAPTPISAPIEGKVTLNLASLISDKDNNLDLTTLKVTTPPLSGASATIDSKYNLILDYTGISFSGTEKLTIQVCDLAGACTQRDLSIEVIGDIQVYNAISPNNDGKNDYMRLEYIEVLADTKKNKVTIFGRWGDVLFEVSDYDNDTRVFKGLNNHGNEIPTGTYFYKIEFISNRKPMTGFITLKR